MPDPEVEIISDLHKTADELEDATDDKAESGEKVDKVISDADATPAAFDKALDEHMEDVKHAAEVADQAKVLEHHASAETLAILCEIRDLLKHPTSETPAKAASPVTEQADETVKEVEPEKEPDTAPVEKKDSPPAKRRGFHLGKR